jgi:transposase-like protein
LGIGCSTLENWVRKASGTVRRELRNDQQRILQPKRENAHLKEVDNIIKKAHMYFMGKTTPMRYTSTSERLADSTQRQTQSM